MPRTERASDSRIPGWGPFRVPRYRDNGGSQYTSIRWPSGSRHLNPV